MTEGGFGYVVAALSKYIIIFPPPGPPCAALCCARRYIHLLRLPKGGGGGGGGTGIERPQRTLISASIAHIISGGSSVRIPKLQPPRPELIFSICALIPREERYLAAFLASVYELRGIITVLINKSSFPVE